MSRGWHMIFCVKNKDEQRQIETSVTRKPPMSPTTEGALSSWTAAGNSIAPENDHDIEKDKSSEIPSVPLK